jgi:hypothetical protein
MGLGDFKQAYIWIEGWRARLRAAGDIVERERYEWRGNIRRSYWGDVV